MLLLAVATWAILSSLVPVSVRYTENTVEVHGILEVFRDRG